MIKEYEDAIGDDEHQIWLLDVQIKNLNIFQYKKKKELEQQKGPYFAHIQQLKALIAPLREEAKPYYVNQCTIHDVVQTIAAEHGLSRREKPKKFRVPKMENPIRLVKRGFASEEEEMQYLKRLSAKLCQEIEKLRSYEMQPDDPYVAYEAALNNISPSAVLSEYPEKIKIYRVWMYESYPAYFEKRMYDVKLAQCYIEEDKQKRARLFANLTSLGTYHVSEDVVTSSYGLERMVAGDMSRKYQRIRDRRERDTDAGLQRIADEWQWLGMKRYPKEP